MEPLTIFGAVTGGISAASEILKTLQWAVATAGKVQAAPEQANSTLRDVRMIHRNLVGFARLQDKLWSVPQSRLSYIPLEDAKNTLVDCVSSLDELENVLGPLSDPSLDAFSLSDRLQWVMKDSKIADLSTRLHNAQSSLDLMLTIMQHESLIEVSTAVTCLAQVTERIAQDVADILTGKGLVFTFTGGQNQALTTTEDDASTIGATNPRPDSVVMPLTYTARDSVNSLACAWSLRKRQSESIPRRFAFEQDLERSIAYRRIPAWSTEDMSFRSSVLNIHALSFLSDLSLGDVSAISIVALPIFKTDISNDRHYIFGEMLKENTPPPRDYPSAQPPPQSLPPAPPSLTVSPPTLTSYRAGVAQVNPLSKVTALLRKRKKSEIEPLVLEKPTDDNNDIPMPPRLPRRPPSPTKAMIYEELPAQDMYSLAQLSELKIDPSELKVDPHDYSLSHRTGGLPCFAIVGTSQFKNNYLHKTQNVLEVMENTRRQQLKFAAKRGHLDFFGCRSCHLSLVQIVTMGKDKWNCVELWCGEDDCAMKLATATPFEVCPCYEKLRQIGRTEKFYGCRNLASMTVQCARCFTQCAGCMEESRADGLLTAQLRLPTVSWLKYLYEFQNRLLESQRRTIEELDEGSLRLRLAILDRESARFDVILEALNTRDLLFDEQKSLRLMKQSHEKMEGADLTTGQARKRLVLNRLMFVNRQLQEYGRLYPGRIAKAHLQILSERRAVLSKRRLLIALMWHQGLKGSPGDMTDAASTASAVTVHITSQFEVYNARWMVLENEREALKKVRVSGEKQIDRL